MTMVPAENLSNHHHHHHHHQHHIACYGGCGGSYSDNVGLMSRIQQGYDYSSYCDQACLGSDLVVTAAANIPMAEDESRTNSLNEAGSSSKENNQEERDEEWLQLSIGGHTKTSHGLKHHDEVDPTTTTRRGGLIELDILPGARGGSSSQQANNPLHLGASTTFHAPQFRGQQRPPVINMAAAGATSFSTSLLFQQQQGSSGGSSTFAPHHPQEINWAYRAIPQNIAMASASSSSSSSSSLMMMPFGSYFARPFQVHTAGLDVASLSSDFRIIDPPRRPHSGIWFMLLASQNQAKEPFLPQLPKSYLRIKDGRMTVRLLIKYLVNKLNLDSESEVEITCRGQQLLPFLTLQHVRDNIWSPRDAVTLLPAEASSAAAAAPHLMVLHYARPASSL